jgi:hypothetical protein
MSQEHTVANSIGPFSGDAASLAVDHYTIGAAVAAIREVVVRYEDELLANVVAGDDLDGEGALALPRTQFNTDVLSPAMDITCFSAKMRATTALCSTPRTLSFSWLSG